MSNPNKRAWTEKEMLEIKHSQEFIDYCNDNKVDGNDTLEFIYYLHSISSITPESAKADGGGRCHICNQLVDSIEKHVVEHTSSPTEVPEKECKHVDGHGESMLHHFGDYDHCFACGEKFPIQSKTQPSLPDIKKLDQETLAMRGADQNTLDIASKVDELITTVNTLIKHREGSKR